MFKLWTAEQYRSADYDELVAYRDALVEHRSEVDANEFSAQFELCKTEFASRNNEAELRALDIAAAAKAGSLIERTEEVETKDADKFDSVEYRNAFMEYVCRGTELPVEYRGTDASTTTSDAAAVIPTTLMRDIITQMELYGELWAAVRKTNVKGGVEYPIADFNPVAYWVGEEEVSDDQKLEANDTISFGYYEIECRLSQSWLASIVTFEEFQRQFVPAAAKAIVKKLDEGIVAGTGVGQLEGIVNCDLIENVVEMGDEDIVDWKAWRSKVKKAIPRAYRDGGVFIMNQGTWDAYIETMADDNNAPVSLGYNPVTGNEIMRFMGFNVLITDAIDDYDTAESDDVFCIYGRLNDYLVNSNQVLQTYQWVDYETRKKKVMSYMVADGKVLDPYSFVLVKKA